MKIKARKHMFFNRNRDISCRKCNKNLKQHMAISRRNQKHYCPDCAMTLHIITDVGAMKIIQ